MSLLKLRYTLNGGTAGTNKPTSATFNANVSISAPTKLGYTFNGWNTAADGTGSSYTDEQEISNLAQGGTVILYAKWLGNQAGPITVTFPSYTQDIHLAYDSVTTTFTATPLVGTTVVYNWYIA